MSGRIGRIRVRIKGLSPLLMNRPSPETFAAEADVMKGKRASFDPEKEAKARVYMDVIDGKEQLYIPHSWLYQCMLNAAKVYFAKVGSRRVSLAKYLAGAIMVEPEKIGLGKSEYDIDIRTVRIKATGGRVLRARPRVWPWEAEFFIVYDKQMLKPEMLDTLKEVLADAGRRIGIGDYRPARGGPFGRFEVVSFEVEE